MEWNTGKRGKKRTKKDLARGRDPKDKLKERNRKHRWEISRLWVGIITEEIPCWIMETVTWDFFFLPSFLFRNFNGDFFPTRFELYFLESSLNSIRPIKFPRSSQNYYPGTYRINLPWLFNDTRANISWKSFVRICNNESNNINYGIHFRKMRNPPFLE